MRAEVSWACTVDMLSHVLQAITSTGTKKGQLFLADVNTQLKSKNITTDVKVDTKSNVRPRFEFFL